MTRTERFARNWANPIIRKLEAASRQLVYHSLQAEGDRSFLGAAAQ